MNIISPSPCVVTLRGHLAWSPCVVTLRSHLAWSPCCRSAPSLGSLARLPRTAPSLGSLAQLPRSDSNCHSKSTTNRQSKPTTNYPPASPYRALSGITNVDIIIVKRTILSRILLEHHLPNHLPPAPIEHSLGSRMLIVSK